MDKYSVKVKLHATVLMLAIAEEQILNRGGEMRGQMQAGWEGIESVRPSRLVEVANDSVVCNTVGELPSPQRLL